MKEYIDVFFDAVWVNKSQTRLITYSRSEKKLILFETYPNIVKIPNAERHLNISQNIKHLAISGDESYLALTTCENKIAMIEIGSLEALFDIKMLPKLEELIEQNLVDIEYIPNNLKDEN